MTEIINLTLSASSWLVFAAAAGIAIQNILYIRKNCTRRMNMHFAFAVLATYMASIYLLAAVTPAVWLIRSGVASKVGILIIMLMLYQVTQLDEHDHRGDRIK